MCKKTSTAFNPPRSVVVQEAIWIPFFCAMRISAQESKRKVQYAVLRCTVADPYENADDLKSLKKLSRESCNGDM